MRRHVLPLVLGAPLGAACSSGGADLGASASSSSSRPAPSPTVASPSPTATPPPPIVPNGCKPSGTKLYLMVLSLKFDSHCLAVESGAAFAVEVDNTLTSFPASHNFSIYSGPDGQGELFHGDLVAPGTTHTFHVDALGAGVYYFRCDVHTQLMKGLFVVR